VAKKALDELGGSIKVDSKLGKGSTFTITLPVGAQKHI
jgi:chemotaxis protein histidine kinase CheA